MAERVTTLVMVNGPINLGPSLWQTVQSGMSVQKAFQK